MADKYFAIKLLIFSGLFILVELKDLTIKDPELICNFNRAGYKVCKSLNVLVKIEQANIELKGDQEIDIDDKNISSINPRTFNNLNITKLKLKLTDNELDLKPNGFIGLSMLESLEINSGIVSLKPLIFGGLESLRSLTLTIDGTRQNFKKSLPELVSLENLTIINSNMKNINYETFYKLYPAINKLDLSNNNIMTIGQGTFSTLNTLTTLIINNNKLKNLQEGMFDGLNKLSHLEIKFNLLVMIEKKMFRGLNNLKTLDLSNNHIEHIGDKSFNDLNISTILLSNNKLTKIKHGIFNDIKSLKVINLNNNQINTIENLAFSNTVLDKLNLNKNNMTFINERYFEGIFVQEFDISGNKINTIAKYAFKKSRIMSIILDKYLQVVKDIWGFSSYTNVSQV